MGRNLAAAGALVVSIAVGACASSPSTSSTATSPPAAGRTVGGSAAGTTGATAAPASTTTAPVPDEATFLPYWLRDGERAPNGTTRKLVQAGAPRPLIDPNAGPRAAIDALIAGPTPVEREAGLSSGFQPNVLLYSLAMEGDTAIVDFSRTFETHDTQPQVAQVVATLTQFDSIADVRFLIEGEPNGATGVPDKTRADIARYVPAVMTELPGPGATRSADGTLKTTGRALLTVTAIPWRVEGVDGPPLAEGVLEVKKQPGDDEWGKWFAHLEVPGPDVYAGPAWLTLSPEPGPPIRIPITL